MAFLQQQCFLMGTKVSGIGMAGLSMWRRKGVDVCLRCQSRAYLSSKSFVKQASCNFRSDTSYQWYTATKQKHPGLSKSLSSQDFNRLFALVAGSPHSISLALELINDMKDAGLVPGIKHYNCVLACLVKEGRMTEAMKLFASLHNQGLINAASIRTVIESLHSAGKKEHLVTLFDYILASADVSKLETDIIGMVVESLLDSQQVMKSAQILLRTSALKRLAPSICYVRAIEGLADLGEINLCMQLYAECTANQISIGPRMITAIITGHLWAGSPSVAQSLYEDYSTLNLPPKKKIFGRRELNRILNACVKTSSPGLLTLVLGELTAHPDQIGEVTLGIILDSYIKADEITKASQLLSKLVQKDGFQFKSPTVFCSVMDGLAKRGDANAVKLLYRDMIDAKVLPNEYAASTLMEGFSRAGDSAMCIRTWNTIYENTPMEIGGSALPSELAEAAQSPENDFIVMTIKESMNSNTASLKAKEYPFKAKFGSSASLSVFFDNLGFNGPASLIPLLWSQVQNCGFPLNINHFNSIIEAYCRHGEHSAALEVLDDMFRRGFTPEMKTIRTIKSLLLRDEKPLEWKWVSDLCKMKGLQHLL
jgi:pentatricopeptide repeat protein